MATAAASNCAFIVLFVVNRRHNRRHCARIIAANAAKIERRALNRLVSSARNGGNRRRFHRRYRAVRAKIFKFLRSKTVQNWAKNLQNIFLRANMPRFFFYQFSHVLLSVSSFARRAAITKSTSFVYSCLQRIVKRSTAKRSAKKIVHANEQRRVVLFFFFCGVAVAFCGAHEQ